MSIQFKSSEKGNKITVKFLSKNKGKVTSFDKEDNVL